MQAQNGHTTIDSFLYMIAMAVVVIYALGVWDAAVRPDSPARIGGKIPHLLRIPVDLIGLSGRYNLLLLGTDDRRNRGRADTIMLVQVNTDTRRAAIVSVPRDMLVEISGHGRDKIGHAYKYGGPQLLQTALENLLNITIHRYVKLDFDSFKRIVDTVGGVNIAVEDIEGNGRGMNYTDYAANLHIHLRPGMQKLDGADAIGYLRYRCDGGDKRTERHRQFLKAILRQYMRPDRLTQLTGAATKIYDAIVTNLSAGEMMGILRQFSHIPPEHVMTAELPTLPSPDHGIFYSELQGREYAELRSRLDTFLNGFGRRPLALRKCGVVVLNGCGIGGAAGDVAGRLRKHGATITAIRNADSFDHHRTIIRYRPGAQGAAKHARAILATPAAKLVRASFNAPGAAAIIITIGDDFSASKR